MLLFQIKYNYNNKYHGFFIGHLLNNIMIDMQSFFDYICKNYLKIYFIIRNIYYFFDLDDLDDLDDFFDLDDLDGFFDLDDFLLL